MDAKDKVIGILSELSEKPATNIRPGMDLVGDLGIDSPQALRLLIELEEKLDIEISDEDAAKMDSVGDILDYVAALP